MAGYIRLLVRNPGGLSLASGLTLSATGTGDTGTESVTLGALTLAGTASNGEGSLASTFATIAGTLTGVGH